jgi:hypothetical protein
MVASDPRQRTFHDACLTSISVDDGRAVLGLQEENGARFEATLEGLEALHVDGFRAGNIAFELKVISGRLPTDGELGGDAMTDVMDLLFPGPHSSAATNYHEKHREHVDRLLQKLAQGNAALVSLDPSYGAALFAYCASVEIRPMATA